MDDKHIAYVFIIFLHRVWFRVKCLKQGIKNRNSVLKRVRKSPIFVLNRVRVCGAGPLLPTQGYIEYPPPRVLHLAAIPFTRMQKSRGPGTGHLDVTYSTVAQSLHDSENLPPSGRRHSASRVSSRVARWEGPWVHLTVTNRAKTSRECRAI